MKPAATLKDTLKPPFTHCKTGAGHILCGTVDGQRRFADVRGWGFFQYFENGGELQDTFKDFLVEALNEKWERDYGEPLRWEIIIIDSGNNLKIGECPKCKKTCNYTKKYNYCPSCGTWLLPPEEEKSEA